MLGFWAFELLHAGPVHPYAGIVFFFIGALLPYLFGALGMTAVLGCQGLTARYGGSTALANIRTSA